MTIQIIDGCIFEAFDKGDIDILFHCCNMQNTFGAGIAKEIKERYPRAYDADTQWFQHTGKRKYYSCAVFPDSVCKAIFNLYGQQFYGVYGNYYKQYGRQLNYTYLTCALIEAAEWIHKEHVIGIPYGMGCGLAGGDWGKVYSIIEQALYDHQVKNLQEISMSFNLDKNSGIGVMPVLDYRQDAVRKINEAIDQNQELFIAQVIKINPDINLIDYVICHMPHYDGSYKFWLERKRE